MKSILAVCLLLVFALAAGPAFALTSDEANSIARDLGCPAKVTVYQTDESNGYFMPPNVYMTPYGFIDVPQPLIGIFTGPDPEAARMILLHEIAHCRQWQTGGLNETWPWTEWNADALAVEWAAQHGGRPATLLKDFLDWYAGSGDSTGPHGSGRARILHLLYQMTKRGYGIEAA